MGKNNRSGQAALLSESDMSKIRRELVNKEHRLFWDIARYTGERWGAICQLLVTDVYRDPYKALPHPDITFRAATRKASPTGDRQTRQVPIHSSLREMLEAYKPPLDTIWLFPSKARAGQHISFQAADNFFRKALEKAGLDHKGLSTHSTRRTFITNLYRKGVDLVTLQRITGHKDIKVLRQYIDVSPERIRSAISQL